jgi:purine-binding chemotaxis protein CheW
MAENSLNHFLSLQVHEQHIVINVDDVQEVLPDVISSTVPNALPFIAGLMNLRGRVVTTIDAGKLLGTKSILNNGKAPFAIVIEDKGELYGLLVGSVGEVFVADQENIENVPNNLNDSISSISNGIYKGQNHLYTIIALDKLLNN